MGRKNADSAARARFFDNPGLKDIYDIDGVKTLVVRFEVWSGCIQGQDAGKWYEGVAWEYRQNAQEPDGVLHRAKNDLDVPTPEFIEAVQVYNKAAGYNAGN